MLDYRPNDHLPRRFDRRGFLSAVGGGFALKYRRDTTRLNLTYDETRSAQYLQDHVISSTLEGFYDEIKRDPQAETLVDPRRRSLELARSDVSRRLLAATDERLREQLRLALAAIEKELACSDPSSKST